MDGLLKHIQVIKKKCTDIEESEHCITKGRQILKRGTQNIIKCRIGFKWTEYDYGG